MCCQCFCNICLKSFYGLSLINCIVEDLTCNSSLSKFFMCYFLSFCKYINCWCWQYFWFTLLRFEVLIYKCMCSFIVCKVCKIYGECIIASICYEVHFCCICICCCEILSNAVTLLVIVLEVVSCFFWFWFYWFWCWSYLFCKFCFQFVNFCFCFCNFILKLAHFFL